MERCIYCDEWTDLYAFGRPVCDKCCDLIDAGKPPRKRPKSEADESSGKLKRGGKEDRPKDV